MYLEVKSKGEIDVQAFSLIGASTKRGDNNKIGLYGSGNKYAIATLMRKQNEFKVFSGTKEIVFTTEKETFRSQEFETILINGQKTSLTTTMGGDDWENIFAPIREIYSNAMDEDENAALNKAYSFNPEIGYTTFYIQMTEDVEHFYDNIKLYFCIKNPNVLFSNNYGAIYPNDDKENTRLFRKGILSLFKENEKALFQYNLYNVGINESRVIRNEYEAKTEIAKLLKSCTNSNVIGSLLLKLQGGNSGFLEHVINWSTWQSFSNQWREECAKYKFAPVDFVMMFDSKDLNGRVLLPIKLLKALKSQFEEIDVLGLGKSDSTLVFIEQTPSVILTNKVIDSIERLKKTSYSFRLNDPVIKFVKFQDESVLGLAENNEILLSIKLDTYSVDEISKIIIEENEHNLSGFADETRAFQNHLFNLYYDCLLYGNKNQTF